MSGLLTAASIAVLLSLAIYGAALAWAAPRPEWPLLAALVAVALPLSWLTYHVIRTPLNAGATVALGPEQVRWLWPFYAPLTEEPAKLLPFLAPWLARRVDRANAVRAGVALGLGFGIGEIALVVGLVRTGPGVGGAPWWQFTGLISERFMVCLVHGAFTATALLVWRSRKGLARGLAAAMALHFVANLPVLLVPMLVADPAQRGAVISVWLLLFWGAAIVWLLVLGRRAAAKAEA